MESNQRPRHGGERARSRAPEGATHLARLLVLEQAVSGGEDGPRAEQLVARVLERAHVSQEEGAEVLVVVQEEEALGPRERFVARLPESHARAGHLCIGTTSQTTIVKFNAALSALPAPVPAPSATRQAFERA